MAEEKRFKKAAVDNSARGLMNYGVTQMAIGNYATAKEYFKEAARLAPNYVFNEINLGVIEGAYGNATAAEGHFRRALALDSALPDAYYYYAKWLHENDRSEETIPLLVKAAEISPAYTEAGRLLEKIRKN